MIGNHVYPQGYRGFESRPLRSSVRSTANDLCSLSLGEGVTCADGHGHASVARSAGYLHTGLHVQALLDEPRAEKTVGLVREPQKSEAAPLATILSDARQPLEV